MRRGGPESRLRRGDSAASGGGSSLGGGESNLGRGGCASKSLSARAPSARLLVFATAYLRRYLARHFNALRIDREGPPPALTGPTILYANHPSWWDPIVLMLLIRAYYRDWLFQGPIDARALTRYPWLERLGLFGIEPGTAAGARALLQRGAVLLASPRSALALTAQGSFTDVRQRPVVLKRGLARLLAEHPSAVAIPVAIEYTFWSERLPEALVRFGQTGIAARGRRVGEIHVELQGALEKQLDLLAENAASRDANRFDCVLEGRRGVGFWQDLPQRLRALVRGERFDAAHAAVANGPARRVEWPGAERRVDRSGAERPET